MADSNYPNSSRPSGASRSLQESLNEVRMARLVAKRNVNIDDHASLPTPTLESLHRHSTMSQTSDLFVGSLLRDNPEAINAFPRSATHSTGVDDSQGPLDVVPIRSIIRPPANVPLAQGPRVNPPETSKRKGSKEPSSLESVKANPG
ncbi:hypothetical protein LIER_02087 [Lithospermum erythrorhizon]|uniref:Uncharacterized protein n=1 Tax=Lithospermum erythrorhizon TaxID=34254 RepID=A0AAV3NN93_LITER